MFPHSKSQLMIDKDGHSYFASLEIKNVTVEDAGKYKVTAKNELGESNATISLNFDSKYIDDWIGVKRGWVIIAPNAKKKTIWCYYLIRKCAIDSISYLNKLKMCWRTRIEIYHFHRFICFFHSHYGKPKLMHFFIFLFFFMCSNWCIPICVIPFPLPLVVIVIHKSLYIFPLFHI